MLVEDLCYMCHNQNMRTAGVREARQDLSSLLDEVRKGREVTITDRGRPVARLVPVKPRQRFPDLTGVRRKTKAVDPSLSKAILDEREDRS
jgi:prevent-host-death family protein